jgi:hypothetical protein
MADQGLGIPPSFTLLGEIHGCALRLLEIFFSCKMPCIEFVSFSSKI